MRPFTVLTGIVLGSAASITFSLGATLIVFALLPGRHPTVTQEIPGVVRGVCAFAGLTAASAGSFVAQLRARSWRGWAHAAMLLSLGGVILLYWPRR